MGNIINMEINGDTLYNYAEVAFQKGDYMLCIQNINEGIQIPDINPKLKSKFLAMLIFIYEATENNAAKMDIILKNAPDCLTDFRKVDFKEFISLDYDTEDVEINDVFSYNIIKDCLMRKDYCTAFGKILSTEIGEKYLVKISELICLVYDEDNNFNINDYFVPAVTMLAKIEDKTKLLSVMLSCGGACKDLATDGMGVFLDDIDDMQRLLNLGETYYINGEMEIAKTIYKKAYEYNEFNEDVLFHLSAINYAQGDKKEASQYFAKYKAIFCNTYLPISMYEKYFESEYAATTPVLYPYLDTNFVDEITNELVLNIKSGNLIVAPLKEIEAIICCCENVDDCLLLSLLDSALPNDKLQYTLLYLLNNPSINNTIKRNLLYQLYNSGYQGRYNIYFESKLITATMVTFSGEHSEFYSKLYKDMMLEMPFLDKYIPLKCNLLKNAISLIENKVPSPQLEDYNFFIALAYRNYAKLSKIIIEWADMNELLQIDNMSASKFFVKYGLAQWLIK
jgi:tetratricopeptide (TPR) repeat protein